MVAELDTSLASAREQATASELQATSLQGQLAVKETQLQSAQQQNSKLLTDLAATQRQVADLSKQKTQAQSELSQLQQQAADASGLSQKQLHALQAEHARLLTELRYRTVIWDLACTALTRSSP